MFLRNRDKKTICLAKEKEMECPQEYIPDRGSVALKLLGEPLLTTKVYRKVREIQHMRKISQLLS
jgi:hypothetical protein